MTVWLRISIMLMSVLLMSACGSEDVAKPGDTAHGGPRAGIGRIKRLFAEILSYEIRAWTSRWSFRRQNPAFSVRQRSHSRLVFHRFLERCTQQAHLILPCCGKSLVKEIEWWFRAGTAPPDPAVPSLHGPGVRVAIPSAPDVVESFLSLRGLRCTRPP